MRGNVSLMLAFLLLTAFATHTVAVDTEDAQPSSWDSILSYERPEGWVQIAAPGQFPLGEPHTGEGGDTIASYGAFPVLDGSTVCVPLAMAASMQLLGVSENDAAALANFSTTHNAYVRLIRAAVPPAAYLPDADVTLEPERAVDVILATAPSEEELALAGEAGVALVAEPVCMDAFVFLTRADNPVESLTLRQIQGIYSGEITNWREVGGPDQAITPYQRQPNSGSQTAMEQMVMQDQGQRIDMMESGYYLIGEMGALILAVGDYKNTNGAIGYSYLYYYENLYPSDDVKLLAVDGVAPTAENIQSGAYPFTVSYYAVRRDGEAAAEAFTAWLVSDEGQAVVDLAGYVPLSR